MSLRNSLGGSAPNNTPSPVNRRASSGRYQSASDEEENDDDANSAFMNYTVHMPPTPDHGPISGSRSFSMDPDLRLSGKTEQQMVSSTIFTGGFNCVTRGHIMEKTVDPEMGGDCSRGLVCAMEGCDAKVMRNEAAGEDWVPCDCDFKICRDCYLDALNSGGQCYGCKEQYKVVDPEDAVLPPMAESKPKRRLSLVRSIKGAVRKSNQVSDFDHTHWLYETKGTYGYGNAVWPKEGYAGEGIEGSMNPPSFSQRTTRPLTRKVSISAGILSPYR